MYFSISEKFNLTKLDFIGKVSYRLDLSWESSQCMNISLS